MDDQAEKGKMKERGKKTGGDWNEPSRHGPPRTMRVSSQKNGITFRQREKFPLRFFWKDDNRGALNSQ